MRKGRKTLLIVGDRVLIEPLPGEDRTEVGLLLPASATEKEPVQTGRVVACGPGIPLPPPNEVSEEPWRSSDRVARFLPMQIEVDDIAVFFRKAAVEILFEGEKFLVVPQSAILVLIRESRVPDSLPPEF
ncbi:MAG TPA: co-chaperone GroES family protein [Planctomycetota bacterium]|jgi:co-chaperonin GroES (HSP10)|nr:co-chaperone GroES family protein [Planctomycetota bacterium]